MKWNIFLLFFSISILLLFAGVGVIEDRTQADGIASYLAPQIGVDEDLLYRYIQDILEGGRLRWIVVYCTPWAIMSILLTVRLIVDVAKERRCCPPIKKP